MKSAVVAIFLLTIVACSASQSTDAERVSKDNEVTCKMERVVGSNIPQKVCKSKEDRRRDQENGVRALETDTTR